MKYPIGIQDFEKIIEGGYAYADKTALIYQLVTEGNTYFLSRPRRFGKSLLLSTISNYFLGKKKLFKGLAIDKLEKDWYEYPVFHLSFGSDNFAKEYTLDKVIESFVANGEDKYGKDKYAETIGTRFKAVLKAAHEKTGRRAVVLIDEYDKPLLDVLENNLFITVSQGDKVSLEDYNRNVLKGFYGVFKDADQDLRFVMLTGVTKFSQVSVFSGFNQPDDISMSKKYEAICGITTDELLTNFDEPIKELASEKGISCDDTVKLLKKKYDGYHFSGRMTEIFNPFSLINCFASLEMKDYWFASGTPSYLVRLLAKCDENINELAGRYYTESQFVNYKADTERPLPMIYQSGYLTIKDYDPAYNTYLLDFPNEEVRTGFIDALATNYFKDTKEPKSWILDVSKCLRNGEVATFEKYMTALLSSITYRFQHKHNHIECERYFQYTFYLIIKMLGFFDACAEKETSEGRIDCIVECPDYVYIIEFKLNGTAEEALRQIADKGYAKPYCNDKRKLIALGINFSSEKGTVDGFKSENIVF